MLIGFFEFGILAWVFRVCFDTKHHPSVTEAVFALISALAWLVLGLRLAVALLLLVWPWV